MSFRTTESALFLYSDSDLESPFANTVLYGFSLRFIAQCLLNNVLLWCVFDICIVSRLDIFLNPLFLLSWGQLCQIKRGFIHYALEILSNKIKKLQRTLSTLSVSQFTTPSPPERSQDV